MGRNSAFQRALAGSGPGVLPEKARRPAGETEGGASPAAAGSESERHLNGISA